MSRKLWLFVLRFLILSCIIGIYAEFNCVSFFFVCHRRRCSATTKRVKNYSAFRTSSKNTWTNKLWGICRKMRPFVWFGCHRPHIPFVPCWIYIEGFASKTVMLQQWVLSATSHFRPVSCTPIFSWFFNRIIVKIICTVFTKQENVFM